MSNVLIVEDDRALHEMLRLIIGCEGYTLCAPCFSGNEAIHALASGAQPEILLLDMQMADGDGLSVLSWLREHPRTLRVIVTTAQPTPPPAWAQPLIEDVLIKPMGVGTLLHRLAQPPATLPQKELINARIA